MKTRQYDGNIPTVTLNKEKAESHKVIICRKPSPYGSENPFCACKAQKDCSGQQEHAPKKMPFLNHRNAETSYFCRIKKQNMEVKDSNGNILQDGDSVTVIKDLKVRGSSDVIKRGTMVKGIRLTDDPAEIDCRVNKTAMVLRTEFVKKA